MKLQKTPSTYISLFIWQIESIDQNILKYISYLVKDASCLFTYYNVEKKM